MRRGRLLTVRCRRNASYSCSSNSFHFMPLHGNSSGSTRCRLSAALACFAAALVPTHAAADRYMLDRDHTLIAFFWNHLGVSFQAGRFRRSRGTIEFDPQRISDSTVCVSISADSIDTNVPALDHQLKGSDWFDAARYSDITFRSTRVVELTPRTAEITGDLTIRDVTAPAVLNVRMNYVGAHPLAGLRPRYETWKIAGFSATTTLKRSQWRLSEWLQLGGKVLVPDDVEVRIEVEAIKAPQDDEGGDNGCSG